MSTLAPIAPVEVRVPITSLSFSKVSQGGTIELVKDFLSHQDRILCRHPINPTSNQGTLRVRVDKLTEKELTDQKIVGIQAACLIIKPSRIVGSTPPWTEQQTVEQWTELVTFTLDLSSALSVEGAPT